MGSVGDAYDNAMCERFFATLECELLARSRLRTSAEANCAPVTPWRRGRGNSTQRDKLDYHVLICAGAHTGIAHLDERTARNAA
jgi:hypothetical protein